MRYGVEWVPGAVLLAAVVVLPLAPAFALIGVIVLALAAVAALVALAGAILATPYLVVRILRRRLAVEVEDASATTHPGFTAVAEPNHT
jgi:hypothetical protein